MVDIAIVAFVLVGAIVGLRKGFVVPLAAAGGALLTLAALYAGPLTGALPAGTAGLGVGAVAIFAVPQIYERDYAAIVPAAPLATGTRYRVRFELSVAGTELVDEWEFETER